MNRDLGVWTHDDCALVLIDYQREMFEVIRSPHTSVASRTAGASSNEPPPRRPEGETK